jgi:hypothetical protein
VKALSITGRAAGVLLLGVGVLILLIAAGASVRAAYVYLGERCWGATQFHCSSTIGDKLFAVGQMIWGLGAAGFALVCCANIVRRLAAGERTEGLTRRSLLAFALMLGWLLGPYLLILIANA